MKTQQRGMYFLNVFTAKDTYDIAFGAPVRQRDSHYTECIPTPVRYSVISNKIVFRCQFDYKAWERG